MEKIVGLVINDKERKEIYDLSIKNNIIIEFEENFKSNDNHLFVIKDGRIGAINTQSFFRISKIIHGVNEYKEFLNNFNK